MNTGASTISKLLTLNAAVVNGQSIKAGQAADNSQAGSNLPDVDIAQAVSSAATDNNLITASKKPDKQQDFLATFLEQIKTENLAVDNSGNSSSQILPESVAQTPTAEQPFLVQTWKTQYAVPVEHNNGQITEKMMPQSGLQLAQSIADLNGRTLPPLAENQPQQIIAEEPVNTDATMPVETSAATPAEQTPSAEIIPDAPVETEDIDVTVPAEDNKLLPPAGNSLAPQAGTKPAPLNFDSSKTTPAENPQNTIESAGQPPAQTGPQAGTKPAPPNFDSSKTIPAENPQNTTESADQLPAQTGPAIISNTQKPTTDKTASDNSTQQGKSLNELSAADGNAPRQNNILAQTSTGDSTPQQGKDFKQSANSSSQPRQDSLPDDYLSQKLNAVMPQSPANPPKQETKPAVDTSSGGDNFGQIFAANNPQTLHIQQPSTSQQAANTANNTPSGSSQPSVGEQLFSQIQNSVQQNQQQIIIRLNPPELGRVVIKFTEQNNQITGLLEVSRPQTRYEIEQALPELLKNLADSGIQIKNFDVLVKDQPQQDFYKDTFSQTGQGDRSGQNNFTGGNSPDIYAADQPANINIAGYQTAPDSQQPFVTDSSINILI